MHVLAIRHIPCEGLGLIGQALTSRGVEIEYADPFLDPAASIDWQSAAGLVVMGGPMSATDDLPYIRRELEVIEQALKAERPILGVCLGSQLLARALGARVYRNGSKEIGWAPVYWTAAAGCDPLFGGLNSPETLFHWHGETFDLPSGAEWLGWSDLTRHQAYRAAPNTYGLQFHIEVTPEMIADWCREYGQTDDMKGLAAPIDPYTNSVRLAEVAASVFGAWAANLSKTPVDPVEKNTRVSEKV